MPDGVFLGFDYGFRRIGVAVGQSVTATARPLTTVTANQGVPHWPAIDRLFKDWQPNAMVIGYPTSVDGSEQYTSTAAKSFAEALHQRYHCPVYLVDERLTTVEARNRLFEAGGYRRIQSAQIDAVAAVLILEQWFHQPRTGDL